MENENKKEETIYLYLTDNYRVYELENCFALQKLKTKGNGEKFWASNGFFGSVMGAAQRVVRETPIEANETLKDYFDKMDAICQQLELVKMSELINKKFENLKEKKK